MSADPISPPAPAKPKHRMSTRNRLLFMLTAWLILLMPLWFWWYTWFGRPLDQSKLTEYLHDDHKPRHIQHALVQMGERMSHNDRAVVQWYPDAVRLASYPVDEVRNTDAWVMGQDNTNSAFHDALLKMLSDPALTVRGNAALSLVRFGDASGRPQIVALLQTAKVTAPQAGKVIDTSAAGTSIHQGGILAKLQSGGQTVEIRSPIGGPLQNMYVHTGEDVSAGAEVATVSPTTEQVWEALRALYLVDQLEDLDAVRPYERELPEISDAVRQQAAATEQAIRQRAK